MMRLSSTNKIERTLPSSILCFVFFRFSVVPHHSNGFSEPEMQSCQEMGLRLKYICTLVSFEPFTATLEQLSDVDCLRQLKVSNV